MPAKGAVQRLGNAAFRQGEHGIAKPADKVTLGDAGESQVARPHAGQFLRHGGKVLAASQGSGSLLRLFLVGEQHLRQIACLGRGVPCGPRLIFAAQFRVGNQGFGGQRLRRQGDETDGAVFRRQIAALVGFVELGQLRLGRLRQILHGAVGDEDQIGNALLVAVAIEPVHQDIGRRGACQRGVDDILAHQFAAHGLDIALLSHADRAQGSDEPVAAESAIRPSEGGFSGDGVAHHLIGYRDAAVPCESQKDGVVCHAVDDRVEQAELARLLGRDGLAESLAQCGKLALQPLVDLLRWNFDILDRDDDVAGGAAPEHVLDAPDGEAENEKGKENLYNPGRGLGSDRLQHGRSRLSVERKTARKPPGRLCR